MRKSSDCIASLEKAFAVSRERVDTTKYAVPNMRNSVSMLKTTRSSTPRRRFGD
jgi:hypothetical protein